jgi:plastocyanin
MLRSLPVRHGFVRAFAVAAVLAAGSAVAAQHTVVMDGTTYKPEALTVKRGDTVVWVNKDPFPHTVTSKEGGFDSHNIGEGKSWRYTARKAGEFPYACTLHPTMKGVLVVQ